ncbi:hypothetical protein C7S17_7141 [Burkholderia thailandensis]|nr:hypothetical protein [Burkholderia thailandensis]
MGPAGARSARAGGAACVRFASSTYHAGFRERRASSGMRAGGAPCAPARAKPLAAMSASPSPGA